MVHKRTWCMKTYFDPSRFTIWEELSLCWESKLAILLLVLRFLCIGRIGCVILAPTRRRKPETKSPQSEINIKWRWAVGQLQARWPKECREVGRDEVGKRAGKKPLNSNHAFISRAPTFGNGFIVGSQVRKWFSACLWRNTRVVPVQVEAMCADRICHRWSKVKRKYHWHLLWIQVKVRLVWHSSQYHMWFCYYFLS